MRRLPADADSPASQVPRFEQLLAEIALIDVSSTASQTLRFERLLADWTDKLPYISFVGTSASSSYLPEQLHHRRNWEFHRCCARSSYLAIALVNIRAMALRGHRALSGFLPGYVPLERSICFAGTALLAVTYLELISAGVREGFVGTALRAVTYR